MMWNLNTVTACSDSLGGGAQRRADGGGVGAGGAVGARREGRGADGGANLKGAGPEAALTGRMALS